ncbi:MAG: hypothetical protein WA996_22830 [Candidatus Promineifilaceae bacterium]
MNENEWVSLIIERLRPQLIGDVSRLRIFQGHRLPYAKEVTRYQGDDAFDHYTMSYQTDILITEESTDGSWLPRLIIEAKIRSVTTHSAITYSQKASTHKSVHPYLRYGIILGNRGDDALPGRLFRHGAHFDFMLSFVDYEPTEQEIVRLRNVVYDEIQASRTLEEMIFQSRSRDRKRYTYLHRPLQLKK